MKHNEVARAPVEGKFEFGLPVGILSKLLKAPHIDGPDAHAGNDDQGSLASESHSEVKSARSNYNHSAHNVHDIHELFTDPPMSPDGSPPAARSQSHSAPSVRQQRSTGGTLKSSGGAAGSGAATVRGGGIDQASGWDESQTDFGADSWVSGSVEKKKEAFFSGGLGNIDYLNVRIPGFPQGGSVKKTKKKKLPAHLTPVSLYVVLCV